MFLVSDNITSSPLPGEALGINGVVYHKLIISMYLRIKVLSNFKWVIPSMILLPGHVLFGSTRLKQSGLTARLNGQTPRFKLGQTVAVEAVLPSGLPSRKVAAKGAVRERLFWK